MVFCCQFLELNALSYTLRLLILCIDPSLFQCLFRRAGTFPRSVLNSQQKCTKCVLIVFCTSRKICVQEVITLVPRLCIYTLWDSIYLISLLTLHLFKCYCDKNIYLFIIIKTLTSMLAAYAALHQALVIILIESL